jgi:hypothetical protein
LKDLEAQAKTEKRAIQELIERGNAIVRLPSSRPDYRARVAAREDAEDPTRGREELRRLFANGRVLLRPQPEGHYIAEGKLYPLAIFSLRLEVETPKARDSLESSGLPALLNREPLFSCSSTGCAGWN